MKTLFFGLLLICGTMIHAATPRGIFQLDPEHSKMTLLEKNLKMNGLIEIAENFSDSKLQASSSHASFESTKFIGDLTDFEVKGILTYKGLSRLITMKGKYFGMTQSEVHKKNRAAFSFTHQDLFMRAIVNRPSQMTTALMKEVVEIVEQPLAP